MGIFFRQTHFCPLGPLCLLKEKKLQIYETANPPDAESDAVRQITMQGITGLRKIALRK